MTQPGPEQPMQYYDTVLVDLPAQPGSQYRFFNDITNKNENLTNLRLPRRIDPGDAFTIKKIELTTQHWSGDLLTDLLFKFGWLEVMINRRIVFADSLAEYNRYAEHAVEVTSDDELKARICMLALPSEWGEPKTTEYVEKRRTEEEEIAWPGRARWLAQKLGLWTPKLKRTSTWMEPVSRPMKGQVAVKLSLTGRGTKPVGA